jgi:hypothetical protein
MKLARKIPGRVNGFYDTTGCAIEAFFVLEYKTNGVTLV